MNPVNSQEKVTATSAHNRPDEHYQLPTPLRERAMSVGKDVLERLADRSQVIRVATAPVPGQRTLSEPVWTSVDPASGDAGLALAFGVLGQIDPRERWEACAHAFLVPAVTAAAAEPFQPLGLVAGMAGLAFTVRHLAQGRRHRKVLGQLDGHVIDRTRYVLQHTPPDGGIFPDSYDVVYGFAGIGRYLLRPASTRRIAGQPRSRSGVARSAGNLGALEQKTAAGRLLDPSWQGATFRARGSTREGPRLPDARPGPWYSRPPGAVGAGTRGQTWDRWPSRCGPGPG